MVASAQSGEIPLKAQPKELVDTTQFIVGTSKSDNAVLHWNDKTFQMVKVNENLKQGDQNESAQCTTLHWNNKVIKLKKDQYLSAPHREYGKIEYHKDSHNCHSITHNKKHI